MRKGDVVLMRLSAGTGHEQKGDRPALLISDTGTSIVIVVPLTGNTTALRFPHTLTIQPDRRNGLSHESVALVFHVRAIDKNRIVDTLGSISPMVRRKVHTILKRMLGL